MTRAVWLRQTASDKMCMIVEGHAGYAAPGRDIVCAAVSTAMELLDNNLTALGLRTGHKMQAAYYRVDAQGYLAYKLMRETARFLEGLASLYPGNLEFCEKSCENFEEWGEIPQNGDYNS
nr:MAG TPA: YsxB-like protein [Caudoviricetes sp.]